MKIEIVSGTKDEPPMALNTTIKIDGKEQKMVNYFKFSTKVDELAYWHMGLSSDTYLEKLIYSLKQIGFKLRLYKRRK